MFDINIILITDPPDRVWIEENSDKLTAGNIILYLNTFY